MQDHLGTTNPLTTIYIIYKLIACSFVETTYNFLPSDKPEKMLSKDRTDIQLFNIQHPGDSIRDLFIPKPWRSRFTFEIRVTFSHHPKKRSRLEVTTVGIQSPCPMMIGVYSHLQNERYLGSMKPVLEGDWIPRARMMFVHWWFFAPLRALIQLLMSPPSSHGFPPADDADTFVPNSYSRYARYMSENKNTPYR